MVLVAILLGNGFLGVVGMIIAVPLAALLTSFVQSFVLRFLDSKNLPGEIEAYHHLDHVDPTSRQIISEKDPNERQSLYTRLKRRNALYQQYEQPIEQNPWDLTMEEIREEDSELLLERKAEEEFKKKKKTISPVDQKEPEEQDTSTQ